MGKGVKRVIGLIAILAAVAANVPAQAVRKDLRELADAERAFSAYTVEHGFRDGFIKFFADDGIGFGPHPERTKEVLQKRPAPHGPRTLIFEWAPMFGDISAAGDMGYTTGPVLYTPQGENARPPFHGMYFSVWQKQADGSWKVVIDMGIDTPKAVAPIATKFAAAKNVTHNRDKSLQSVSAEGLREIDNSFSRYIAEHGMAKGYANWLDRREFRVHRKGKMPIVKEEGLMPILLSQNVFEFIDGKISESNDMAFTYGKYLSALGGSNTETGSYVHVWRRDSSGKWKLVADVQNPLPKSEK